MATNNKAGKKAKDLPIKSLATDQATEVVGGQPMKYMEVKLKEVLISGV